MHGWNKQEVEDAGSMEYKSPLRTTSKPWRLGLGSASEFGASGKVQNGREHFLCQNFKSPFQCIYSFSEKLPQESVKTTFATLKKLF